VSRAPSPGDCNCLNSDFDRNKLKILKKKRVAARSGWSQNVSFDSTEGRFAGERVRSEAPPPGAYEGTYNTISGAVSKWKQSKTGPFLTSAKVILDYAYLPTIDVLYPSKFIVIVAFSRTSWDGIQCGYHRRHTSL
jgi:hypothetical protein